MIKGYPAIFIKKIKTLVISDLHIGYEIELLKSGIHIPSQLNFFIQEVKNLIEKTKAKTLVINGDLKHKIINPYRKEKRMVVEFVKEIEKTIDLKIVKGNHDGNLEKILPNKKIYSPKGFCMENFGFFHGHAWPSPSLVKCDWLIMAHLHPGIKYKENFGYKVEKVFIFSKLKKEKIVEKYKIEKTGKLKIVIIPHFNNLLTGIDIFSKESKELSPIMKENIFDYSKAKIYSLNGILLGNWKK